MSSQLQQAVPENQLRFAGHGMHSHEVPHLIYAFAGRIEVRVGESRYVLHEGESLWLAPEVPHAVRVFASGLVLGPMLYPHVLPPHPVTYLEANVKISSILRQCVFAAARLAEEVEPFRQALCRVLLQETAPYFYAPRPHTPLAQRVADRALRGNETLQAIAASQYCSTRQVQRIFLEETGLTFSQWRRRTRLNRAFEAARKGMSRAEIIRQSGYANRAGLAKAWARESDEPVSQLWGGQEPSSL